MEGNRKGRKWNGTKIKWNGTKIKWNEIKLEWNGKGREIIIILELPEWN